MRVDGARTNLETLQEVTSAGNPYAPVPQRWLDEFHEILRVIATRESQQRYRLDRLTGINRQYFHAHMQRVLNDFDHLVDEQSRRDEAQGGSNPEVA